MVFFCCNSCGDTLKKQKVEHHSCRGSYSCIDCNVNFTGNEFEKHTKCVTEAERYQGNLYEGKEDKGAKKQDTWMVSVRDAAESCKNNSQLKGLLVRIAENDNVPRKKVKFLNFIRNSTRVGNKDLVEKAWDAIEKAGKPPTPAVPTVVIKEVVVPQETVVEEKVKKSKKKSKKTLNSENVNGGLNANEQVEPVENSNGNVVKVDKKRKRADSETKTENLTEVAIVKKKKKKSKESDASKENTSLLEPNLNHVNGVAPETPNKVKKYKLSNHIQELVFNKEEISLKKLKRKVTAAYLESYPHKSPEEASRLFDKKVMKVPGVCVEHGTASKEMLDIVEI